MKKWYCRACEKNDRMIFYNSREELLKNHPVLETERYLIASKEVEEVVEHRVNSDKYSIPAKTFIQLTDLFNCKIDDIDKINGKDCYYILIKVNYEKEESPKTD